MEEAISRMAGSQHDSAKTVAQLEAIVAGLPGRVARQRLTDYRTVPVRATRRGATLRFAGVLPSLVT